MDNLGYVWALMFKTIETLDTNLNGPDVAVDTYNLSTLETEVGGLGV